MIRDKEFKPNIINLAVIIFKIKNIVLMANITLRG